MNGVVTLHTWLNVDGAPRAPQLKGGRTAPARDMASAGLMGRMVSRTSTSPGPGFGTGFCITAGEAGNVLGTAQQQLRRCPHHR